MHLSKRILISLLVFGLVNPVLANTEGEKEDPNTPYYYIAAVTIALGVAGLGVFLKRDAIKGWFKKRRQPPSESDLHASERWHPEQNADAPDEGTVKKAIEVAPIVATIIASQHLIDDQSTTAASSTVEKATKLEETFELKETVTVTETPLAESSQASKKPERGQKSPEFLANQKFLERHLAKMLETAPTRPEPTVNRGTAVKTKSEIAVQPSQDSREQSDSAPTVSVKERSRRLAIALGKENEEPTTSSESTVTPEAAAQHSCQPTPKSRNTVTNDPTDEPPSELPPSEPLSGANLYHASLYINSESQTHQITDEVQNFNIIFGALLDAEWILVSDGYEELDEFMGVSLPSEPGQIYCFVNPNVNKVIFPRSQEHNKGLSLYSNNLLSWWRIQGSSHSAICIRIAQPEDLPQEDVKSLKQEKKEKKESEAKRKREKKEREKDEKDKKDKKDKGGEQKKHFWQRNK